MVPMSGERAAMLALSALPGIFFPLTGTTSEVDIFPLQPRQTRVAPAQAGVRSRRLNRATGEWETVKSW